MEVRVVFVFRRSAIIFAPSTLSLLAHKLQTGVKWTRQRLLTLVFRRGRGSVLERREGLVCLEALSKLCCAFISNSVLAETASKRADKVSEGADTFSLWVPSSERTSTT